MGSIRCVQGQAERIRESPTLIPISEGIIQDILQSFEVQESQEGLQDFHLAPDWEQLIPLFSGEMREFLPACLSSLDWSSRERSLSGRLVQSLVSGFVIHLRISLSEVKGGVSRIQLLTSKISHICQEIRDIKSRKKPQSNLAIQNYVNTGLDEGLTKRNYTWELDSSNSAKEGSNGGDGWSGNCSSHSTLHPPEPNNLNILSGPLRLN